MNAFIISGNGVLNVLVDNKPYTIGSDHVHYNEILEAVKNDRFEEIPPLADVVGQIPEAIQNVEPGTIEVKNDSLYYNGKVVHGVIVDRILVFMKDGLPFQPLMAFLKNLQENPSNRCINELYAFMEKNGLCIDKDGYGVGYKSVRQDYKDWYSGTIDNSVGQKPFMPRNEADDDYHKVCSNRFHIGNLKYVKEFHPEGRHMIVRFNPKDVVSVPTEGDKLGVNTYEVIGEYEADWKDLGNYYSVDDSFEETFNEDICEECGEMDCACDEEF